MPFQHASIIIRQYCVQSTVQSLRAGPGLGYVPILAGFSQPPGLRIVEGEQNHSDSVVEKRLDSLAAPLLSSPRSSLPSQALFAALP